jgi:hypothetical protein
VIKDDPRAYCRPFNPSSLYFFFYSSFLDIKSLLSDIGEGVIEIEYSEQIAQLGYSYFSRPTITGSFSGEFGQLLIPSRPKPAMLHKLRPGENDCLKLQTHCHLGNLTRLKVSLYV